MSSIDPSIRPSVDSLSLGATSGVSGSAGTQEPISLSSPLLGGGEFAEVAAGGTLERGARGEAVQLLQTLLNRLGFDSGRPDGIFGSGTGNALSRFQRDAGLTGSGRFDQASLAALDQKLTSGPLPPKPGAPNDVVFVGMGDGAAHEIKDMAKRTGVLGITDSAAGDDKVVVSTGRGKTTFDLATTEGVDGFVDAIGLSGEQAARAKDIIGEAGSDAKDEVALTIKAFAEADRGDRQIERFVLSGHSVGSGVWGDSNGYFQMDLLEGICETFPNAAAQVEDFLIAGCYSSSERHVQQFRDMFPNLKSSWAYGDSAPGTWTGAMVHNKLWEAATRDKDSSDVNRTLASGTRKGENVATWNVDGGYMADGETRPLDTVRGELDAMDSMYQSYFSGESPVLNTQYGPMRDRYRLVQEMLGNPRLPAGERPALEAERDATIRLIFYDANIKGRFQETHGAALQSAFQAVGQTAPDFSKLSRAEALQTIEQFVQAAGSRGGAVGEARALLEGLRDLDPDVIPANWV